MEEPNYDVTFKKLDCQVSMLAAGDLPLEAAFHSYEQSMELIKQCNDCLMDYERQIVELAKFTPTITDKPELRSLEVALTELDGKVTHLDNGQFSMEDAMSLYHQGIALVKECTQVLYNYEQKILSLSKGNHTVVESPFSEVN